MSLVTRNALIALLITIVLTGTVAYAMNYLNNARITELSTIEDQLSIDILSLDTQFSLLEAAPCDSSASSTTLTGELANMGARLSYAENQLGSDNAQVIRLKEKYSLLEIRDYLITKKLVLRSERNPQQPSCISIATQATMPTAIKPGTHSPTCAISILACAFTRSTTISTSAPLKHSFS